VQSCAAKWRLVTKVLDRSQAGQVWPQKCQSL